MFLFLQLKNGIKLYFLKRSKLILEVESSFHLIHQVHDTVWGG